MGWRRSVCQNTVLQHGAPEATTMSAGNSSQGGDSRVSPSPLGTLHRHPEGKKSRLRAFSLAPISEPNGREKRARTTITEAQTRSAFMLAAKSTKGSSMTMPSMNAVNKVQSTPSVSCMSLSLLELYRTERYIGASQPDATVAARSISSAIAATASVGSGRPSSNAYMLVNTSQLTRPAMIKGPPAPRAAGRRNTESINAIEAYPSENPIAEDRKLLDPRIVDDQSH
jgi:hypothetical protein